MQLKESITHQTMYDYQRMNVWENYIEQWVEMKFPDIMKDLNKLNLMFSWLSFLKLMMEELLPNNQRRFKQQHPNNKKLEPILENSHRRKVPHQRFNKDKKIMNKMNQKKEVQAATFVEQLTQILMMKLQMFTIGKNAQC